jgi:hypothetical protein
MDALRMTVIHEMSQGYRPTYGGVEWGREHYAMLEAAVSTVEMAFDLLKAVQFPGMAESRLKDVDARLGTLLGSLDLARLPALIAGEDSP